MKMSLKKVLAAVLALTFLAACFTACGSKGTGSSSSDGKTLKIGSSGPLTGDAAAYGIAVKNGIQLAVDEINAAGGVNGMKLEFQMEDDEADAEKAVNAYNTLKDNGMKVFIGTVTTGACLSVVSQTKADNMFQITPSASATKVIANDNCFQVCFTDPNQGTASADYIASKGLATKVAVIYNSSDAYSSGIYDNFKAEAAAKGLDLVASEAFTGDSKQDFSSQLSKIKASGAELIFLPIYYQEASLILSQAKNAGITAKFFGCDGLDGLLNIENFDKSLAENVMLLTPFAANATDETTKKFVTAYNAKYDPSTLNQFAADAYDAVYVVKAAAEKAGVTGDMSVSDICNALKGAMTEITVDGVTGSGMTWKATGEVNKEPKAVKIENGEYQPMD